MAVPFSENGGFAATTFFVFMPSQASDTGATFISVFDAFNFNDTDDDSSYSWRVEEMQVGRYPVIRRVILVYTDLGKGKITVTVSGVNDNNKVVTKSKVVTLGTTGATGLQLTMFVDISVTCFRPQLSVSRKAGDGPVSIVSASLIGEIEEVSL